MTKKPGSKPAKRQGSGPPTKPAAVTVNVNPGSDRDDGPTSLRPICGSVSKALNGSLANQALTAMWVPAGAAVDVRDNAYYAGAAAMMAFKPADAIEGMMAAQAVGLHSASMECLRRAMIPEQPFEAADRMRRQGANMSRAFLEVVAALDRKRGKGVRQVVRVERVMVAPGGQAIVGNVQAGAAGGGQHGEGVGYDGGTGGEPHAPPSGRTTAASTPARLAHDAAPGAVLPPLRGTDPDRDALPVARDGQRAVPNARGHQHGA